MRGIDDTRQRTTAMGSGGTRRRVARVGTSIGLAIVCGCAEQDLYEAPDAPYVLAARLSLPAQAQDVSILGHTAYVSCGQAGLIIVDVSDPAHPVMVDMIDTKKFAESIVVASVPVPDGISDMAFVVEGTEGITTYDVTDPDAAWSYEQGTTAVDGNGLFVEIPDDPSEPYVVYLAENWKGLRIFESDPTVPGLLRYNGVFSYTRGYAKSVVVKDGYAYVADDELGLAVMDVRERVLGVVDVVSACDTEGFCRGIDLHGNYAVLADGTNGVSIMRIDGANEPVPVGNIPLDGFCRDVVVRDGIAVVAAQDGGVHVLDVTSPTQPEYLGTILVDYATGVDASADGVVVASDRDGALHVLHGPGFRDTTAPSTVRDLAAAAVDSETVVLTWGAPGDDGFEGSAAEYDIRYATEPIAMDNWDDATQATGEPSPARSGSEETHSVSGLLPGIEYTFALRSEDEAGNRSSLSGVALATTPLGNVPPTLTDPGVSPEAGSPTTTFAFEVVYTDGDGNAPTVHEVRIDGSPYQMTLISGTYEGGALYRYQTTLASGSYEHVFVFNDGHHPDIATALESGPRVGEVFTMGSPPEEIGRDTDESQHVVVLTRDVWVSPYEVKQSEYETLMGSNPSVFAHPDRPVENVSWFDAIAYCNARSSNEGYTPVYTVDGADVTWNAEADGYRLPTEAEWERACRAGTSTAFANGPITEERCETDPSLDTSGWYCGNTDGRTQLVGQKGANPDGLYDMHGNVWEWCWDWYAADPTGGNEIDPAGPDLGSQRVIRGGSWYYYARDCRSASRAPYWPNSKDDVVGFRVVRTLP